MQFTGIVSVAFATLAVASPVSAISWPTEIPGHGNLTIDMAAIATGTNSTVLKKLVADNQVPETFTIAHNATIGCDEPADLSAYDAVSGVLCLDNGVDYNDFASAFVSKIVNEMTGNDTSLTSSKDSCSKSCYCTCEMACIASLFFYPLCWAGCTACSN